MKDRIKEEISNIEQPHFCEKEKERNLLYPVIPWVKGVIPRELSNLTTILKNVLKELMPDLTL